MCAGVVERVTRRRLAEAPPRVIKASCNGTECNLNSKHQVKRSARRQPHPPIEKCETKCDPDVVDRTMQFDVVQSRCDSKQHLDVTDGALQAAHLANPLYIMHPPRLSFNSSDPASSSSSFTLNQ